MGSQSRINGFHTVTLLSAAAFVDTLQTVVTFIPVVGPFIATAVAITARIVFGVWFMVLRVGLADKSRRFIANISMTLAEMLPLINALPIWTIGMWTIIRQVKKEDKENHEKTSAA